MSVYSDFLVWGNNQDALLSKSSSKCLTTPTPFSLPYEVISISASEKHIAFLTKDGIVYSYGNNLDGRLGVSSRIANKVSSIDPVRVPITDRVIKIQCGFSHVCALTQSMQIFAWGHGDYGALGIGQFKSKSSPTRVQLPRSIVANIKQISCGAMHTAFLSQAGDVFMCGSNQYGQLGINKPEKISTPTPISFHLQVQQVSCGVFYTLLLTKDGRIYGMGNNKYGQLGIGHKVNQSHPTLIRQLQNIVKITAGYHSGAIDQSGTLYIWGSGSFGEYLKPKKFVLSVPIRDISIRGFFGLAIGHNSKYQSRIYTWGNNTFGQLGLGSYQAAQEPLEIEPLRGVQAKSISLGVNFAILVLHNDRQPFLHNHRSPRIPEGNVYTDRKDIKEITNFDDSSVYSYRRNRSRSREGYRPSQTFTHYEPRHRQPLNLSPTPILPAASTALASQANNKNYQKLFLTLSDDYQILLRKYQDLQKQLQQVNLGSATTRPTFDQESLISQLQYENKILKTEIAKLRNQNEKMTGEAHKYKEDIDKLQKDKAYLIESLSKSKRDEVPNLHDDHKRQNQDDSPQISAPKEPEQPQPKQIRSNLPPLEKDSDDNNNLIAQLESQYNKILNEKELLITQLRQNHQKKSDQLYSIIDKIKEQRTQLQNTVNKEKSKFNTQRETIRAQLDAVSEQLNKEKRKLAVSEDESSKLKNEIKIQEENLKKFQILNHELENTLIETEKKYQAHEEELLKRQILIEKLEQMEIQLSYEKQFNRKYEATVIELQEMRQKIYKELTLQIDTNKAHKLKIEEMKGEIQTYKKYKKNADEKAIQIEQMHESFNAYKSKVDQLSAEKDEKIDALEEQIENRNKFHAEQLQIKDNLIEDLNNNVRRIEKQQSKAKDTIAGLKQQIMLKDEEIEHLSQSKTSLEKKNQYLQIEYQKQYEQRERMGSQLGEIRRQFSKIKITLNQVQDELSEEKQKNMKLSLQVSLKQDECDKLEQQNKKNQEKIVNLIKENTMYREQIDDLEGKIQKQMEMNRQLSRANEEFAHNEEQFSERINELERTVRELEEQNKSYTPRYEALIQRNKELDERNRELGEMVNKAVQIQAESYKNNILKQVQINTDQFLNDVNDEQTFKNRGKRKVMSKQLEKLEQEDIEFQSPLGSEQLKIEPYTKMMKERISAHKRKVSESAHKLANLLNMNDGQSYRGSRNIQKTEDYQQINSQMQNFSNHKEQFISKIHSYAQKLKIL